ncbi:MAG TPA: arginyltransferase [Oleiagrimonas sp.]|nr:arginyltransferase [Oleiagrimonas sp.]
MRSERVRLFQTLPHACGYYPERVAQNLVIDPAAPQLDRLYPQALAHGFRRAGGHLYHPRCPACHACTPCRIPVNAFAPDRSQRRCRKRNADLDFQVTDPGYSDERYALYKNYLGQRHRDGGMDDAGKDDFVRFLDAPWSATRFLEWRLHGHLLAVAVTDVDDHALSAVYTFFDPAPRHRGLGTYAVMSQIAWARKLGLTYVYLGYWIEGHPKMDYKRRFRPLEVLREDGWRVLDGRSD